MADFARANAVPTSPTLWGLYCACSWTWCIGMFLPVLLFDRFGWPGFVAFAVPNVFGCAAMGFVLRSRTGSAAAVAEHGGMMVAFSLVTVAYQLFFCVWLLDELLRDFTLAWWAPLIVGVIIWLLGVVFSFLNDRDWLALASVAYAISIAAFIAVGWRVLGGLNSSGSVPSERLLWLIPIIGFGFVLCPYLDLTFHRAVQSSSRPRASFAIFGATFAVMLLLTVAVWFTDGLWGRRIAATLALGHLFAQLIFTVGVHLREIRMSPVLPDDERRPLMLLLPVAAIAGLPIARLVVDRDEAGEWAYLSFLAAYGLVFPAYVLVAMASGRPLRGLREWSTFAILIAVSLPFCVQGFLFNRTPLLLPPLATFIAWWLWRRRCAA